jgi:diaminopimelate epimerase
MQGIGNDFIVIDDLHSGLNGEFQKLFQIKGKTFIQTLCDRRYGVGCDQLLWLKPSAQSDVEMVIYNADGSEAEMCGNGIRAVGVYLQNHGPSPQKNSYKVDTKSGVKVLTLENSLVTVDMGMPQFAKEQICLEEIEVCNHKIEFYFVDMGNPHAVVFVDDFHTLPLETCAPLMEKNSRFTHRTNIEFVKVTGENSLKVKVWERGAGWTLGCGTGACAASVAAIATQKVTGPISLSLPGGILELSWKPGGSVFMKGPAVEVYNGQWPLD